ncbi:hypothetical protein F511_04521 [Dorcoceras hygrometricum]|uniref:Uncharacterized protein n=1 Tax=Dorcoceras hygrometricum TaxID=472368 RepID=A0A2Z7D457_9LAMI|nr:hypothetical protein F511_04521 [Dorcoceras hygrometricum]
MKNITDEPNDRKCELQLISTIIAFPPRANHRPQDRSGKYGFGERILMVPTLLQAQLPISGDWENTNISAAKLIYSEIISTRVSKLIPARDIQVSSKRTAARIIQSTIALSCYQISSYYSTNISALMRLV